MKLQYAYHEGETVYRELSNLQPNSATVVYRCWAGQMQMTGQTYTRTNKTMMTWI